MSGVTFKNSKFWTTHFYDCEDVVVHDCSIVADVLKDAHGKELKGPSTDAIDIDKCRRFTVRNVDIAVNDDGVVVKGGKGPWADDYGKFPGNGPSSDVLVENCTFRWPTHSALTGFSPFSPLCRSTPSTVERALARSPHLVAFNTISNELQRTTG